MFFGNEAGDFFCLDFRGGIKWRFRAKRAITSSPVINGEFVLFSSLDASLYALEAKSGWAAWRFVMGKGSISTPCVAGDLVFLGAIDGFIYCVDLKSGKEVWKFPTEHQVTSSPIIYKELAILWINRWEPVLPGISHRATALEVSNWESNHRHAHCLFRYNFYRFNQSSLLCFSILLSNSYLDCVLTGAIINVTGIFQRFIGKKKTEPTEATRRPPRR